jgi:hypothetical protein
VWNSRSQARASSQFPPHSDTYRRLRETHGEIGLSDEDRVRPHRSSVLAFAPEAKGLRAHSLYYDSAVLPLLPLYRRLGVEYDCSYQMPLLGGLRPFRKHHEIVKILTCYGGHFDVMTGATGISWARGPGAGARTPLIYLLMAVSARRLSTATVGEVNVHWRSVAKWM